MRVLVVDDEPFVVEGVARMLAEIDSDMIVEKSCVSTEALDKICRRSPDLMIVDIEMPEMNGLELVRAARDVGCGARVIMLTGYSDYDYMRDALKQGIFDYVLKINGMKAIRESVMEALKDMKEDNVEGGGNQVIETLKMYIENHLKDDLSLSSLSGQVFLNPSYLSRIFRQETGRRLSDYVLDVRLRSACRFLSSTDMQIQEIAREVGFENAAYFNAVFRRKMNLSPAQWRKAHWKKVE